MRIPSVFLPSRQFVSHAEPQFCFMPCVGVAGAHTVALLVRVSYFVSLLVGDSLCASSNFSNADLLCESAVVGGCIPVIEPPPNYRGQQREPLLVGVLIKPCQVS